MRVLSDRFQEAGSRRAGLPDVSRGWPVFEKYTEERTDDDIFLEAVVESVRLSRPASVPGLVGFATSANWQDAEQRSVKRYYAPITQHKDLFLKFARYIPNGSVPLEEEVELVKAWVSKYGVLGLYGVDDPRHPGRRESVRGFWQAATEAARVLDLFEVASPKKPDQRLGEVLDRWEPDQNWSGRSIAEQREYALGRVNRIVGRVVKEECYPQLWRVVNEARKETRGFTYDFGFHSLLGAMYLQMMLLLTDADNTRQCQRPGCLEPLPPGSNKNRMYCSAACKQWVYDNNKS